MAYFRKRGNSIALLYGVRQDLGVRQKRLKTFSGPQELEAALQPAAWGRLQVEVEQRMPDCILDWTKLHRQAEEFLKTLQSPSTNTWSSRREHAMKAASRLARVVRHTPPEERDRLRGALGPILEELVSFYYNDEELGEDQLQADMHVELARAAHEGQNLRAMRVYFERAREFAPYDPDVLNSEAVCWIERRKYDKAEERLLAARHLAWDQLPNQEKEYSWSDLRIRPYIRATYNLGMLRHRQGKLEEAFELFEECLARCPNDGIGARYSLGPLLMEMGRLPEAAIALESVQNGNLVDLPDPYYDGALVMLRLERETKAARSLLLGIAINPHIAAGLVKKSKPRTPPADSSPAESRHYAFSYLQEAHQRWSVAEREWLKSVLEHRDVKPIVQLLVNVRDELQGVGAGPERSLLLSQEKTLEERLANLHPLRS